MAFAFLRRGLLAVLVGLIVVGHAAASQAQQSFFWWRSEEFKNELGLTAEQAAKIENIHQTTLPELRQEWDELNRYEAKLSKLLESSIDEAVLARQIDRVETARANLNKTRSLMIARFRLVLNAEQRARFKVLAAERWPRQGNRSGDPDSRRRSDRPRSESGAKPPGC